MKDRFVFTQNFSVQCFFDKTKFITEQKWFATMGSRPDGHSSIFLTGMNAEGEIFLGECHLKKNGSHTEIKNWNGQKAIKCINTINDFLFSATIKSSPDQIKEIHHKYLKQQLLNEVEFSLWPFSYWFLSKQNCFQNTFLNMHNEIPKFFIPIPALHLDRQTEIRKTGFIHYGDYPAGFEPGFFKNRKPEISMIKLTKEPADPSIQYSPQ